MLRLLPIALLASALGACDGPTYTQERVSNQELAAMVAGPLDLAERGDLSGAQREFETLLKRSRPEEESDLLTAFGVGLHSLGDAEEDDPYRRASIPYLERSVPAAIRRFGSGHPEVALALNTYADALRSLSPDDPPRQVDQAYARAFAIRERTLGRINAETLFALFRLAQVQGLPSRTGGDPARIERAAAMFRAVIQGREANPDQPSSESAENVRLSLVEMYVRNRDMAKAVEVARTTELVDARRNWRCDVGIGRAAIAAALKEKGRHEEAEAALDPETPPPPACLADEPHRRTFK
jgi:tetratricopeptide (TPR) repeat protein